MTSRRICVFGAGSIGCYVGGRLAAAGGNVLLVGRERFAREINAHGLHLTDYRGADLRLPAADVQYTTDPASAADADLVLVTVKSAASAETGALLAGLLTGRPVVVSLQNGIGNAQTLQKHLPELPVLPGMVGFNVLHGERGAFHHGTDGELMAGHHPDLVSWLPLFAGAGIPLELRTDMAEVQWGKLLLNLNNPVNALAGIPLKEELSQRSYRLCVATLQMEALHVLRKAGIQPVRMTPLPVTWVPRLLGVPDFLFRILGGRMLAIDPLARSSMWEDLESGRVTEVDWLNGEVVRLAAAHGLDAPANQRIIALIRNAETGGRRDWKGDELLRELTTGSNA